MADAPADARCDIRMTFDEWRHVKDKPLFFLDPARIQNALGDGLTVEQVYRGAGQKTKAPLGRDAVKRALEYQPSFLSKILDIKNVVNSIRAGSFDDEHVIAAVFSMPHLNADLSAVVGADNTEAGMATGYGEQAVIAAREHYRVPLDLGLKLLKFTSSKGATDQTIERCLTISGGGDRRYIKNLGVKERPIYVFGADHLVPAPVDGHPWQRKAPAKS